jgi:hypothetical protein
LRRRPWRGWLISAQRQSDHGVVVGGPLWERLLDTPVFDNLAVVEPEDIHRRHAAVLGCPVDQAVGHDQIALSYDTFDRNAHLRKLAYNAPCYV